MIAMSVWQYMKRVYRVIRYSFVTLQRFDLILGQMDTRNIHSLEQSNRLKRGRKLIDFINTGKDSDNE